MADRSAIEWTDSTFNPWIGCTKVSPACDHCYAEVSTPSRTRGVEWGAGKARQRTSAGNWKLPLRWNTEPFYTCDCGYRGTMHDMTTNAVHGCGRSFRRVRRRVFCASLADVFDNEIPVQWRVDLFELIERTPHLDWLLLTKRIGNAPTVIEQAMTGVLSHALPRQAAKWPLPNVWIGATICNQAEADRDIPKLLSVPAAVRFLSIEPMLGPVDLTEWLFQFKACTDCPCPNPETDRAGFDDCCKDPELQQSGIGWVIAGGESGTHARPMHPFWGRSLRDQCAGADVPFLFKQWGEWAPRAGRLFGSGEDFQSIDPECKRWPDVIRLGEDVFMQKVGKKTAGRILEGAQHDGYPEVFRANP